MRNAGKNFVKNRKSLQKCHYIKRPISVIHSIMGKKELDPVQKYRKNLKKQVKYFGDRWLVEVWKERKRAETTSQGDGKEVRCR